MKAIPIFLLFFLFQFNAQSQSTDKAFQSVYERINSQRIFNLDRSNFEKFYKDSLEIVEIHQLMDFLNSYLEKEQNLNGSAGFSFSGNENETSNLYVISVKGGMDKGSYPYELDFSLNAQTILQNGIFQENITDIDVSYDFHPLIPEVGSKTEGLWLENYVFFKRFNNNFLGIDQRYEVGAGFVINFYSKKKLTETGNINLQNLEKIPKYEIYGDDLSRCLEECYLKESILGLTKSESDDIVKTREFYKRSNIKQYSKFRFGLLVGIYYEIEQANATNELLFDNVNTTITEEFEVTNKLRWEIRPAIRWQPKDKFRLRINPFFKLPLGEVNSIVREGDLEDSRYDYFMDLKISFEMVIEKNFSISFNYRQIYDNAAKRKYLQQSDGTFILLEGQQRHSNYGVSFNFGF